MVSNGDNWIRIFDITDVSKHRKGFTIYKIISMLYPETCPDAVTKLTVWKRFNDFKKLHRDMKVVHKSLHIKDKYPTLPSVSFFKRFDEEIVQARRQAILNFLEFIAYHSQLYKCNEFVKFFESSHMPVDQMNSNINSIRADLNLPDDPEFLGNNSDDEPATSDTDSITTLNSTTDLSSSKSKLSLNNSHCSKNSDTISIATSIDSITLLDNQIYPAPITPEISENNVQYIIDASVHVNMAMDLENEKKFEEAYAAYKTAVEILLKSGKDDKNYDRKQMVRYKTEKYLIRAERIYNMHLSREMQSLKEISESDENMNAEDEQLVQRPTMSELYKYKVVRVIASGMLVLHSELQQLFYIKVIHKTMKFLSDNLILPECVPYMVKLYNYYNCENALFLVLEYCSGKKIWDYIKYRTDNPDDVFHLSSSDSQILRCAQELELSEPESEHSYSDLINDYVHSNKNKNPEPDSEALSSDDSYEKVSVDDMFNSVPKNIMDERLPQDTHTKSSDLLFAKAQVNNTVPSSQRKISEVSSFDEVDVVQNYFVPEEDVIKWSAQLLVALDKLHKLGVICRDLQAHNLLINDNGDLILTYMCNVNELCDVYNDGAFQHLAPELYSFQSITEAVDWWCYGAILYELLVGMPLSEVHPGGLTSHTSIKVPKYVSPEGRSLLKQLLVFEPKERLGFGPNGSENLKSHPFFHSISWDDLLSKYV